MCLTGFTLNLRPCEFSVRYLPDCPPEGMPQRATRNTQLLCSCSNRKMSSVTRAVVALHDIYQQIRSETIDVKPVYFTRNHAVTDTVHQSPQGVRVLSFQQARCKF